MHFANRVLSLACAAAALFIVTNAKAQPVPGKPETFQSVGSPYASGPEKPRRRTPMVYESRAATPPQDSCPANYQVILAENGDYIDCSPGGLTRSDAQILLTRSIMVFDDDGRPLFRTSGIAAFRKHGRVGFEDLLVKNQNWCVGFGNLAEVPGTWGMRSDHFLVRVYMPAYNTRQYKFVPPEVMRDLEDLEVDNCERFMDDMDRSRGWGR